MVGILMNPVGRYSAIFWRIGFDGGHDVPEFVSLFSYFPIVFAVKYMLRGLLEGVL